MPVKRTFVPRPTRRRVLQSGVAGVTAAAIPGVSLSQPSTQRGRMARILVFDVNETLLDLSALESHFERVFRDKSMLREWFNQVILYAEAVTLADNYGNFGEIARAALEMTAAAQGVKLSSEDAQSIVGGIRSLPAHTEV